MSVADWRCEIRTRERITDPTNAYDPDYLELLRNVEESRVCPFSGQALEAKGREIVARCGSWFVIDSIPHYKDRLGDVLPHHFLIVSVYHGLSFPDEFDFHDIGRCTDHLRGVFPDVKGWGLAGRLGRKSEYAGQSILHTHLHFFSSNV